MGMLIFILFILFVVVGLFLEGIIEGNDTPLVLGLLLLFGAIGIVIYLAITGNTPIDKFNNNCQKVSGNIQFVKTKTNSQGVTIDVDDDACLDNNGKILFTE